MTIFKIATWNINSLRVRLPHVQKWLAAVQPDVLALQEIKLTDDLFPVKELEEAGYTAVISGQRTYNGVALLSRAPVTQVIKDIPELEDHQRRVLAATLGDMRILNLYVPNGESVQSSKYQYKLQWLNKLDQFLKSELQHYKKMIILGDFNIAPEDIDVHNPKIWQGRVLFSEPEKMAFKEMLKIGFTDCFRYFAPEAQTFTWWDYRLNAFKRNMGLRIDHILASAELMKHCQRCYIDPAPRTWERPSDHTPVVAEFNI